MEENTKKRAVFSDPLRRHLAAGLLLEGLAFLLPCLIYRLRFPKLMLSQALPLQLAFLCLLLPFLNAFFGIAARVYQKASVVRLSERLCRPLLLIGILLCLLLCAFPAYCSSTGSPRQYLQFDDINPATESTLRSLFPEAPAAGAGNPRYQYYKYRSVLEENVQVSLGETLTEAQFRTEVAALRENPLLQNADWQESGDFLLLNAALPGNLTVRINADCKAGRLIIAAKYHSTGTG